MSFGHSNYHESFGQVSKRRRRALRIALYVNAGYMVAEIIGDALEGLDLRFPEVSDATRAEFAAARKALERD